MRKGLVSIVQENSRDIEKKILSEFATRSCDASRRFLEKLDVRPNFFRDTDRILHSKCYTRYIDKTQVFYLCDNDDITHRVLHVQFVSKIARTIGRALKLNEDLIEAIALGHDVGHPPFGHEGGQYLDELCVRYRIGHFVHSVQGVVFLDEIEKREKTEPLNLSLQVLDGILCHDGEMHNDYLIPKRDKTWTAHLNERKIKIINRSTELIPMTLEGCVVRFADVISYVGRDIQDAITVGLHLPPWRNCARLLGKNNRGIINTLVSDLIENSRVNGNRIGYSRRISAALKRLRNFNLRNIYLNKEKMRDSLKIKKIYNFLFDECLRDIKKKNSKSIIYSQWIEIKDTKYIGKCKHPEIVRDFLSSLTDDYFIGLFKRNIPEGFGLNFRKRRRNG